MNPMMDYALGAVAGVGACILTNPMEVIKTRMQLQGELKTKGLYDVHYRNVLHGAYRIIRTDGVLSLQRGLFPAMTYQLIMNGIRLGTFQNMYENNLTKDKHGNNSLMRTVAVSAFAGGLGAYAGSPANMVGQGVKIKTQLQAKASKVIAVGTQHDIQGFVPALSTIYHQQGISGLWRGSSTSVVRVMVGSMFQLPSFIILKDFLANSNGFNPTAVNTSLIASFGSSLLTVLAMTPLDVITTRMYNQPVCPRTKKGLLYLNFYKCFQRIRMEEGWSAFYKGTVAHYLRIGPHTVLTLVLWDALRVCWKA